ncbi:MAG: GNAT family N-acetyltransferase [bacterium]
MCTIKEIQDKISFTALEHHWNDLLERSKINTPFLTWQWLSQWWEHYGTTNWKLNIFLIKKDNKAIGIAPFILNKSNLIKLYLFKKMIFLGSFGVGSDFLDFIVDKGKEDLAIDLLLNHLILNNKNWDVIHLTNVLGTSSSIEHIVKVCSRLGCDIKIKSATTCPFIELPNSWDAFFSSLSRNTQSSIKRQINKLNKQFHITYEVIEREGDLSKAMGDLFNLNRFRMKEKGRIGAFLDKKFTEFHEAVIPILFKEGILRLCFLKANEERIAALYNFIYNKTCFFYQGGFNPDWKNYSPGTVILSYSIKDAIEKGLKEYSLLQGAENYKFKFTDKVKDCLNITIFNKTLKGRFIKYTIDIMAYLRLMKKGLLTRQYLCL